MSLMEASIKRHTSLNPRLWDGDRLKPDVREALIRFGQAWAQYAKIPAEYVHDVMFVGGNASYYYSSESDIDVHVLIDKEALGDRDIIDQFLDDRKTLWTIKHHVTVMGYTVEPYAQSLSDPVPVDEAVYSLLSDEWVSRPVLKRYDPAKDSLLDSKVGHWKRVIDRAVEGTDAGSMRGLKERLKTMRGEGLKKGGELSQKNLVYKELRNSGHLDKLKLRLRSVEDAGLSL